MSVEIRPALGNYDGFYQVVGVKKPGGKGCWCMSYRDSRVPADQREAYMRAECDADPGPGVLAYVDGEAAGWCSVAPRSSYRRLLRSRTIPELPLAPELMATNPDAEPWCVVCFVIRPAFRRRGLMHALLEGAVAHVREQGGVVVEGYPVLSDGSRTDVISGYVGSTGLFEDHGFEKVVETNAHSGGKVRWLMRRTLTEAG